MVIDPYSLLEVGSPYRLNELYYIMKQIIPALQRVFGLLGADLNKWFNEIPRPIRPTVAKRQSASGHGSCSRDGGFILLGLNKKASTKGSRIDTYLLWTLSSARFISAGNQSEIESQPDYVI
jgi:DNA polymerase zeta